VESGSTASGAQRLAQLEIEERTVSSRRRRVQDRLDFMRSGAAVPSADHAERVQQLEEEERTLSAHRRELHAEIDMLRTQLGRQPGPQRRT
jgi:predicted  nucleic acid-binding Zn-ribbon protein